MRNFALFLVLLTSIGFTLSFVRNIVPTARRVNAFLETKQQNRANEVQRTQIPFLNSHIARSNMFLRSSESESETEGVDMLDDIEFTKGMPDKTEFTLFYRKTVSFGSEMTLQQVRLNQLQLCS